MSDFQLFFVRPAYVVAGVLSPFLAVAAVAFVAECVKEFFSEAGREAGRLRGEWERRYKYANWAPKEGA